MKKWNWKTHLSFIGLLLGWYVPTIILFLKTGKADALSLFGLIFIMSIVLFLLTITFGKSFKNK